MKSFKFLVAAILASTGFAGNASAGEADYTITKNVTVATDYVFRGISQNDEAPALQGSIGYEHKDGFHAEAWASTINFADDSKESVEVDLTAGYAFKAYGVDFDLGAIQYYYPGTNSSSNYDFLELYASAAKDFGPVSTKIGVNYSGDYFAASGQTQYYSLAASMPVYENLTATASAGRHVIEHNDNFGTPDYTDGSIGLEYDYKGFTIGLSYIDTSLSKNECADGCEGRGLLFISRDF